jgi:hypothetical protein
MIDTWLPIGRMSHEPHTQPGRCLTSMMSLTAGGTKPMHKNSISHPRIFLVSTSVESQQRTSIASSSKVSSSWSAIQTPPAMRRCSAGDHTDGAPSRTRSNGDSRLSFPE